ncbi:prokaryotic phospholipase A2-domain-containing protein [Tirmania nivea]|nr:prokaryotic phospholipase A2-domain-containing protein [Tirmania nivea]
MKITAILLLFSLSVVANAAAIVPVDPVTVPAPATTKVSNGELEIDYDAITDDVRGDVEDSEELADDEELDDDAWKEDNNYGIVARGDIKDETILERDELPDGLERRESIWERGLAAIQRRETANQATDRLCFQTSISSFLAAKKKNSPNTLNWTDDGCSNSPDRPAGFNFLHSCQRHDFGYRNFKKQNRFTKANRLRIDDKFKSDLYNECENHGIIKRTACKRIADTYYIAVRTAGGL